MCGRFAQGIPKKQLEQDFGFPAPDAYDLNWNVSPGQEALVVLADRMGVLKWGFIPHWTKDLVAIKPPFNARSETAFEKPMFRDAARRRRCLIPASAFYEWQKAASMKKPFAIRPATAPYALLAGIFDQYQAPTASPPLSTFAILTTQANALLAPIHDRMPVILDRAEGALWLSSEATQDRLQALLVPAPEKGLECLPVRSLSPTQIVFE